METDELTNDFIVEGRRCGMITGGERNCDELSSVQLRLGECACGHVASAMTEYICLFLCLFCLFLGLKLFFVFYI